MVKKIILLLLSVLFIGATLFAQNKINGKVLNNKNEAIAGVTVIIKGTEQGTSADLDGRFTVTTINKNVVLTLSAIGYKTKNHSIANAGAEELLIVLEAAGKQLEGVVVRSAGTRRETVNAVVSYQKNTNTVASVVSAESIRRSPDRNTGEVLKRTPGTSLQEGKFIIVRGLADRYNQAMVNGILLSSTEADRKAFSFDLFPANMIESIIINKAFVPELPGEWAGGLIQVNTRDIPANNFFNIQLGTGFNTQTVGKDFYTYNGGKTDWLGFDDGTRSLPLSYTTKGRFNNDAVTPLSVRTEIGKQLQNVWSPTFKSGPLNASLQASGGFNAKLGGSKTFGGIFALTYSQNNRFLRAKNNGNLFGGNGIVSNEYTYNDDKYSQDVLLGAMGNISLQLNNNNKISWRNLFNINTTDYVTNRYGLENFSNPTLDSVKGYEFAFKQNTFFNTQLTGEHNIPSKSVRLKWYGSFNVLDAYIPDQRRILYTKNNSTNDVYRLLMSSTLSQRSGNRYYQYLNDYLYTGGADVSHSYTFFNQKQTLKAGYLFQVKDRLFDAKPFSIFLPVNNEALKVLSPDVIFSPENFGNGTDNKFAFDAIKGNIYRYLANTILNAGYVQSDNQFSDLLRLVWGVRVEGYDQLVGSVQKKDPRYTYSNVVDILPGFNATFLVNNKTNIRLSGSQTVVRPEFRELTNLNYYDFELNAAIQGNPALKRTKITNADLRYEVYPRVGELFTAGLFYKYFNAPIEQVFNLSTGGASTFNFQNPDKAQAYGAELEFRKKLDFADAFRNLTIQSNFSFIRSRVKDQKLNNLDRGLQGQSDFLINAAVMYDAPKPALSFTLLYNQIGKRIAFVGGEDYPDIWESSRPIVDLQVSKKLLQNKAELRLNVSDIFNKTLYFYQNIDGNTNFNKDADALRFTRNYGTSINATFGYNF